MFALLADDDEVLKLDIEDSLEEGRLQVGGRVVMGGAVSVAGTFHRCVGRSMVEEELIDELRKFSDVGGLADVLLDDLPGRGQTRAGRLVASAVSFGEIERLPAIAPLGLKQEQEGLEENSGCRCLDLEVAVRHGSTSAMCVEVGVESLVSERLQTDGGRRTRDD